jgi:hypothetical protein
MVTVVLPWRPQPSRVDAFERVVAWYRQHLPEAEIVTVDSGDDVFNLARCRNIGVTDAARNADSARVADAARDADAHDTDAARNADEVVVIGDADTLPEIGPLRSAIAAARTSPLVQLPYTEYHWLGREGTEQFHAGTPLAECEFELVRGACSGVYVTTPATWWSHGGQDERFRGWGFEDAAWFVAHETLLGAPPQRHEGAVYALHHTAEVREGPHYDANATLMESYREASGSSDDMARFVFDASASNARVRPGV